MDMSASFDLGLDQAQAHVSQQQPQLQPQQQASPLFNSGTDLL
jgi:hypothetical protein